MEDPSFISSEFVPARLKLRCGCWSNDRKLRGSMKTKLCNWCICWCCLSGDCWVRIVLPCRCGLQRCIMLQHVLSWLHDGLGEAQSMASGLWQQRQAFKKQWAIQRYSSIFDDVTSRISICIPANFFYFFFNSWVVSWMSIRQKRAASCRLFASLKILWLSVSECMALYCQLPRKHTHNTTL